MNESMSHFAKMNCYLFFIKLLLFRYILAICSREEQQKENDFILNSFIIIFFEDFDFPRFFPHLICLLFPSIDINYII